MYAYYGISVLLLVSNTTQSLTRGACKWIPVVMAVNLVFVRDVLPKDITPVIVTVIVLMGSIHEFEVLRHFQPFSDVLI